MRQKSVKKSNPIAIDEAEIFGSQKSNPIAIDKFLTQNINSCVVAIVERQLKRL